jgi:hypothetical protein
VEIAGRRLRCQMWEYEHVRYRRAQLNTSVATFFNFDWANPSAECFVCDGCGYIHWFLPER